jgi:hypothetical protein
MKTKVMGIMVALFVTTIACTAQRTITVQATNDDISNNLDLQAVASAFGESTTLEDFENKLNDFDSRISNLDLNNDGEVDYLRVIENMDNNVHMIVIQAVLSRDIYQDIASIYVEKRNRRTVVQVVGDSYLYGPNYVIEPVFVYTPPIFSFMWSYNYRCWYSPYTYGYYPRHFRYYRPLEINIYLTNIHRHINHDHRYYYSDYYRYNDYDRMRSNMSRHDYATRYPDRDFSRRNNSVSNKRDFDNARGNNSIYDRRPGRWSDSNQSGRQDNQNWGARSNSDRNRSDSNQSNGIGRSSNDNSGSRNNNNSYGNRSNDNNNSSSSRGNGGWQGNDRGNQSSNNSGSRNSDNSAVTRSSNGWQIGGRSSQQDNNVRVQTQNSSSRSVVTSDNNNSNRPQVNQIENRQPRQQPTISREVSPVSRPEVRTQPSRPSVQPSAQGSR